MMTAYPKEKYEADIEDLKKMSWTMSLADISTLQKRAKKLFNTESKYTRRVTFPAPEEDDALLGLFSAIQSLSRTEVAFDRPAYVDVNAEWVFASEDRVADTPPQEGPVLLYVHGGGYIYGSPGTARRMTRALAALTGGVCLAVQYRHATVQPFPAQLLDVFVAYLSLLRSGMPGRRIIFTGESSGLSLLMALIQVLLHQRHTARKLQFHGQDLRVQLPAAVAGLSGFFDITNALPSWGTNDRWDSLPEVQPTYMPGWKDQEVWPSVPERADLYCERSAMGHPLVSPVAAEDWRGAPPCFIAVGEERVVDANLYLAQTAARQGVRIRLERWEYMTHDWPMGLPSLPHSKRVLVHWAEFCKTVFDDSNDIKTQGWCVSFADMSLTPFDVSNCTPLTRQDVLKYVSDAQKARPIAKRRVAKLKM